MTIASNQHRTFVKQSDTRTTKFVQQFIVRRSCKQLNAAGEHLFIKGLASPDKCR